MSFAGCCGLYLDDRVPAPTAEALMRSRYTAYTHARFDYLRATWHPATCPLELTAEPGLRWLGLTIKRVAGGTPDDLTGTVEFIARSKRQGRAARLHETSYFARVDTRWLYLRGDLHPR